MEAFLGLILIYGGIFLIYQLFDELGKWNEYRKSKIRNEVALQVFPNAKKINTILKEYQQILQEIGYYEDKKKRDIEDKESWNEYYKENRRKYPYHELLGKCQECNEGYLKIIDGKYGKFIGCSGFPRCRFTINIKKAKVQYKTRHKQDFMYSLSEAYKEYGIL